MARTYYATYGTGSGSGSTQAIADRRARAEEAANCADSSRMDREEGVRRDRYGFAVRTDVPACSCPDGPDADGAGTCRVCGGHD